MPRVGRVVGMVLALAGCGGGGAAPDLPLELVFPVIDVVVPPGDSGAWDPDPEVPERDVGVEGDGPGEASGEDAPEEVPVSGDAGDSSPDLLGEVASEDPGGGDPGADGTGDPGDAAPEVQLGLCPPGSATCRCESDEDCDPAYDEPCRPNRCARDLHRCVLDSGVREGEPCEDGDFCTTGETCHRGSCKGGVATCECRVDGDCPDDGNPCTDTRCDLGSCTHPPNDVPCDDGDGCTEGDRCVDGTCVPGPRWCECDSDARCDDGLPCTADRCREGSCSQELAPGWCRIEGRCVVEGDLETPFSCLACRPDRDPFQWMPLDDDASCSDGNPCTDPDRCLEGACIPGPMVCECVEASMCDDGNPCTDDTCVQFTCVHDPNALPCEDGDPATLGDACDGGSCRSGPRCGDSLCDRPRETCATCPADCGVCPDRETLCGDGWDDDLDGLTDCADGDCTWLPPCTPDTCTKVDADVTCGFRLTSHMAVGNQATGNACGSSMSGDDTVWRFVSETRRQVTFRVEDPFWEDQVEAYVLSGACNPVTCIGRDWGWWAEVTFTAEAGRPYYLVYDEVVWGARVSVRVTCQ
ncbi:MAG TPA: hypothetical protein PLQ97_03725 [Myxococcota bacterium]|nr:hypothetical protein [Myxococcota bacterium]HQK50034.1 hypothetical protein [Myxococcota bacterium]